MTCDVEAEAGRRQTQWQQEVVTSPRGHGGRGGHELKEMPGSGLGDRVTEPTGRAREKLSQSMDE